MVKLKIKDVRKHKHISQKDLAIKAGISQSYLSELESNRKDCSSPTLNVLNSIAKSLNVCIKDLIECQCEEHNGRE